MEKENMFLNQMQQSTINELNCSNFWENLVDRSGDLFESALSSTVSSPTASNNVGNGENIVLRELIGRLGGVSGEVSTHPYNVNVSNSVSCYSTPLSSPPKLNLSTMMMENHQFLHHHQIRGNMNLQSQRYAASLPRLSPFSTDPGFAERAARLSCFAKNNMGVSISSNHQQSLKKFNSENDNEFGDSRENSTVSEQIPNGEIGKKAHNDSKKRKADAGVKGKENSTVSTQVPSENSETRAKRIKPEDASSTGNEKDNAKKSYKSDANDTKSKDNSKTTDPPKDYIHVRARRGQATDAHSLAERFRREKISERMKYLQDLVPGCNKVTGKAVMLDEIINYVQSLQRQVEFLSMKLATVNPITDFNIEGALPSKMSQPRGGSFQHSPYASEYHQFQAQANLYSNAINNGTGFNADLGRNQTTYPDNFSSGMASQVSTFWEDDLHSVVQMGITQNQT